MDDAEIRARWQATTPGTWITEGKYIFVKERRPFHGGIGKTFDSEDNPRYLEDAEFIAHAHQDVPALQATLDTERAKVAAWEHLAGKYAWHTPSCKYYGTTHPCTCGYSEALTAALDAAAREVKTHDDPHSAEARRERMRREVDAWLQAGNTYEPDEEWMNAPGGPFPE